MIEMHDFRRPAIAMVVTHVTPWYPPSLLPAWRTAILKKIRPVGAPAAAIRVKEDRLQQ
jgi:hypothetical protein